MKFVCPRSFSGIPVSDGGRGGGEDGSFFDNSSNFSIPALKAATLSVLIIYRIRILLLRLCRYCLIIVKEILYKFNIFLYIVVVNVYAKEH